MFVVSALVAFWIVLSPLAANDPSDVFSVSSVAVDSRARSTSEARSRGLQAGQIDALDQLFRRLVPKDYYNQLPNLSVEDTIDLVRDFSVANERSSSTRYLADLTVRFWPDSVRSALRFANVPFSETQSKPIVVIPVYQASVVTEPTLWQNPNPWRDAWFEIPVANGLVPRQLPYGDLRDLTTLQSSDAVARDHLILRQLARRYDADDAVVVLASLVGGTGSESVYVTLYFTRSGKEYRVEASAIPGQTWSDLFVAAAIQSWAVVEDEWKRESMLQFGVSGQITAVVPLAKLEDWLIVKRKLAQAPLIDRFELQAMTRDRAQVTVYYLGDESQLKLAMAQLDLTLVKQQETWVIENQVQENLSFSEQPDRAVSEVNRSSSDPSALFGVDQIKTQAAR